MELKDIDLEEMLGTLSAAITPLLYGDLGDGAPAHIYIERADLQGLVMGRIMAVLMKDEISAATISEDVELCVFRMREQIRARVRAGIGPGGTISAAALSVGGPCKD